MNRRLWVAARTLGALVVLSALWSGSGPKPEFSEALLSGHLARCEEAWAQHLQLREKNRGYIRPLSSPVPPPDQDTLCLDCCQTWDESSDIFEEVRPGWIRYTNARFGFSVEIPADWYCGCPPFNGDGLSFHSPDGFVHLSFYGFNNVQDGSNPLGLATLEENVRPYRASRATPVAVDRWEGLETVLPYPDPADPDYAGACIDPKKIGCFIRRQITLLGLTEGRGIVLTAAVPQFPDSTQLLDEILRTYRAGDLDKWGGG